MQELKPGSNHTFTVLVSTPDGAPAIPTEPGRFRVLDKDNKPITEGRLMRGYVDGEFETQWVVPTTKPNNPYKLQAQVNTADFGWLTQVESFRIQEEEIPDYNYIKMLTYGKESLTINSLEQGRFQIAMYEQSEEPVLTIITDLIIGENTISADDIKFIKPGMYTAMLNKVDANDNPIGEPSVFNFAVAPMRFWSMLPRLRTYIDRYHKNVTRINGYTDEMMYTWFIEGLSKINSLPFLTSWSMVNFPKEPQDVGLVGLWIRAAAYYGLRSQVLVEGELQFDYNGPNVSITRDQMQALEAEIGRLEAELEEAIKQAKKIIKANGVIGVLSHRKIGARSFGRGNRIVV